MTEAAEDAQRIEEIDIAVRELMQVAQDTTLSALTQIRTWDLVRQLIEEKADILQLD